MLLVWCSLLTDYELRLVHDNLCKMVPRLSLLMVQVHGERVSLKGYEFKSLSVCTLYTCESVAGWSQVRESVRYITHNSYAISVVLTFNKVKYINILIIILKTLWLKCSAAQFTFYNYALIKVSLNTY